ncbi:cytochrome P450 [Nocardia sp. NPDC059240]|uniref:cytochrome P450 n=1 Tax=Nocardia sp. NPDC059240 TaxID=3346786 RepID=UPI0036BF7332
MKNLPVANGLRLLGNPSTIHQRLLEWSGRYGPLYRFNLFGRPFVVVSETQAVQRILRERPDGFRRLSAIESVLTEMGVDGLFAVEGEEWQRRRRLVTPAFTPNRLRGLDDTVDVITDRLARRWRKDPVEDVHADLMRFTVDVMARVAFGYDLNTLEGGGNAIEERLQRLFPMIGKRVNAPVPYWRYVKLPADRALDRALRELREDVDAVIATARTAETPTNFVEALIQQHEDSEAFTAAELFAESLTVLVAGQDTTANTLAWLLYHLAQHPEVRERIRAESAEEKRPYLAAVIAESMRLLPISPFLFLESLRPYVIDDTEVPAGTAVIVLPGHGAVDEANFDDPEAFRPERWLTGYTGTHNAKASMPFGGGPRFCPGRSLALLEIEAVATMVCRDFELSLPTPHVPPRERFTFAVEPVGLRLLLTAR